MSTPADELTAAADKLDALIAEATDGPWHVGQEVDGVWAERKTVVRGGQRRVVTVGQTRPHYHVQAEGNVAYIAAMNPLVGKALAEWLRVETRYGQTPNDLAVVLARLINGEPSN